VSRLKSEVKRLSIHCHPESIPADCHPAPSDALSGFGSLRGCEEIDQRAHPEAAGAPSERQRARCAEDAEGSPEAGPVAGAAHFEILRRPPPRFARSARSAAAAVSG